MSRLSIGYNYILSHGHLPIDWLNINDFRILVDQLKKDGYHIELDSRGYNVIIKGKEVDFIGTSSARD